MMKQRDWRGVFPAITTPFRPDLSVDHEALAEHVSWLIETGCVGIVALGSLGEAQTLTSDEKIAILATCRRALSPNVPVIAGIAGLSTVGCVSLARRAVDVGCDGIMALPCYVYKGDWRETKAHYSAVIDATPLSCMLYNNPVAYGVDVTPDQVAELAQRHENLHAIKESSGDVRRVTALRERLGDRLAIFAGMDDMILESIPMGAVGWIAGLVNAFPEESVRLVELGLAGRMQEARELYEWFLPLLRLDTVPKFVQLIKLAQAETSHGSATVRPPRLELEGAELAEAQALIRSSIATRAAPAAAGTPLTARV
ncbi:MAG: dihydrodipicolinate synthetase [Gemmatimonadetes bacterium]|jgi:dihydrodipicolinate synthase/N-acetylneuraminate lyase|nr:dihydrodipicolinate synthetase [Gemmatimonadota bacterium]